MDSKAKPFTINVIMRDKQFASSSVSMERYSEDMYHLIGAQAKKIKNSFLQIKMHLSSH